MVPGKRAWRGEGVFNMGTSLGAMLAPPLIACALCFIAGNLRLLFQVALLCRGFILVLLL